MWQPKAALLLIGPNCMGFTNFEAGVPVTFEAVAPYPLGGRPGVGVVAQSGAMAANLRDAFMGRGQPLTAAVSTGNEAASVSKTTWPVHRRFANERDRGLRGADPSPADVPAARTRKHARPASRS